jgi:hypothetical protein
MNYGEWEGKVPQEIKSDPLWRLEIYRLGLFIVDIGWHDTTRLIRDRRTRALAAQLSQALGAISTSIANSYSRPSREERVRFYTDAVRAVSQSSALYYEGRHVLGENITWHRRTLLAQLARMLQEDPASPASSVNRETLAMLLENVFLPQDEDAQP